MCNASPNPNHVGKWCTIKAHFRYLYEVIRVCSICTKTVSSDVDKYSYIHFHWTTTTHTTLSFRVAVSLENTNTNRLGSSYPTARIIVCFFFMSTPFSPAPPPPPPPKKEEKKYSPLTDPRLMNRHSTPKRTSVRLSNITEGRGGNPHTS